MPGATIPPEKTFFDLQVDQFQTVLNLNLTGTVIPTQVFLEPMVKQGKGSIINFSSMASFRPMTRVAGYAAAKAGIIAGADGKFRPNDTITRQDSSSRSRIVRF